MMSSYCEVCQRLFCGPHEHLTENSNSNNSNNINGEQPEQLQCKEQLQTMWENNDKKVQNSYIIINTEQGSKNCKINRNKRVNIISENKVNEKSPSPWRPRSIPPPLPNILLEKEKCQVLLEDLCYSKHVETSDEEQIEENNNVEESITAVVQKLRHALKKHQVNKVGKLTEREESNTMSTLTTQRKTEKSMPAAETHNLHYIEEKYDNEKENNDNNAKRIIGRSSSSEYEDRLTVKENISPFHQQRVHANNENGETKKIKVTVPTNNQHRNTSDELIDNNNHENEANVQCNVDNNSNSNDKDDITLCGQERYEESAVLKILIARERVFETSMSNEMERLRSAFVELCHAVKEDIDALGNSTSHNTTLQTSTYSEQQQQQQHEKEHQRSLSSSPNLKLDQESSLKKSKKGRKVKEHITNCNTNEISGSSINNIHRNEQSENTQIENEIVKINEKDNANAMVANVMSVEKPTLLELLYNADAEELQQIVSIMMPEIVKVLTSQTTSPLQEYISRIAKSACQEWERNQEEQWQEEQGEQTQKVYSMKSKEEINVNNKVQQIKIDSNDLSKLKEQLKKEIVHEIREEYINSFDSPNKFTDANVKEEYLAPRSSSCSPSPPPLLVPLEPSFNHHMARKDNNVCSSKHNQSNANTNVEDVLSAEALEAHVRIAVQSVLLHEAERIKQKEKEQHNVNASNEVLSSMNVSKLKERIMKNIQQNIDGHVKQAINETTTRIEKNMTAQIHNAQHTLTLQLDEYINKTNAHYQSKQKQLEQLLSMAHNKSSLSLLELEESTSSRNKMAVLLDDRVKVAERAINTLTAQLTSLFHKMEHWQRQEQNKKENETKEIMKLIESNCVRVINKMLQTHEYAELAKLLESEQLQDKLHLLVSHLVEEQMVRLIKPCNHDNYNNNVHEGKQMRNNSSTITINNTVKRGREMNNALIHDMVCSPSPSPFPCSTSPPYHITSSTSSSSSPCSPFVHLSTTALPQQSPLSHEHETKNTSSNNINHNLNNGERCSNNNNTYKHTNNHHYKDDAVEDEINESMVNNHHRHVMNDKESNNNVFLKNGVSSSFVSNAHTNTNHDSNYDIVNGDNNYSNSSEYKADIKALLLYIRRVLSAHQQMTDVLIDKRVATLESQWNAKWGSYQTNVVQLQGKLQSLQQQMRHALSELAISCNVASPGL